LPKAENSSRLERSSSQPGNRALDRGDVTEPGQQVEFIIAMGNWMMFSLLFRNLRIPLAEGSDGLAARWSGLPGGAAIGDRRNGCERAGGFSDRPARPGSMQDGGLLSDIPAVDDEFGAGNERRLVGGEEQHALSHFYRLAKPAQRGQRDLSARSLALVAFSIGGI
jgi:hypothetical protein